MDLDYDPSKIIVIDDNTSETITHDPSFGRGAVPRDYSVDPEEMFAPPSEMPLIPRDEIIDHVRAQDRDRSSLYHIRMTGNGGSPIPSLNQNPIGYCWGHSVASAVMLDRVKQGLGYTPLSAFAVCATIMNGADRGGWCGLAAKFIRERGIPSQALWPQGDRDYRKYDRPEVWEDAARRKITSEWVDLTRQVWEQKLTIDQVITCLLMNIPCALDFRWWGHSVGGLRARLLKEPRAGQSLRDDSVLLACLGIDIWNSWGDEWGDRGVGTITGNKMIPMGAIGIMSTTASA